MVTCDAQIGEYRLRKASLHQAMRSTDYKAPFLSKGLAVITTGFDNAWNLNTELPSSCSQTGNLPSSSLSHFLEVQPSPSPEIKSRSKEVKSTFHIYIYMAKAMQEVKSVPAAILDFSKTFEEVRH